MGAPSKIQYQVFQSWLLRKIKTTSWHFKTLPGIRLRSERCSMRSTARQSHGLKFILVATYGVVVATYGVLVVTYSSQKHKQLQEAKPSGEHLIFLWLKDGQRFKIEFNEVSNHWRLPLRISLTFPTCNLSLHSAHSLPENLHLKLSYNCMLNYANTLPSGGISLVELCRHLAIRWHRFSGTMPTLCHPVASVQWNYANTLPSGGTNSVALETHMRRSYTTLEKSIYTHRAHFPRVLCEVSQRM